MFEMKIEGIEKLQETFLNIQKNLKLRGNRAVEKAAEDTADFIKEHFDGHGKGFKDDTGALRASIRGGLVSEDDNEIIGFVGAGDDSIGNRGKMTKDYVNRIEFGEFSHAGQTAFLRPGIQMQIRQIRETISEFLRPDNIL